MTIEITSDAIERLIEFLFYYSLAFGIFCIVVIAAMLLWNRFHG